MNSVRKNKSVVHIYLDSGIRDMFQRLYPYCMTRFLINAVQKAVNDKSFFEEVFYQLERKTL